MWAYRGGGGGQHDVQGRTRDLEWQGRKLEDEEIKKIVMYGRTDQGRNELERSRGVCVCARAHACESASVRECDRQALAGWLAGLGRLEVHTVVVGTVVWRQRKAQGKACEEDRESRAG